MKKISAEWLIVLMSALFFIPFLGAVHLFDWDEINFAEAAREMLVSGDYFRVQIDFKPFWEKPPLFIWMQALSMKIFGVNEFAARFPNAVAGIATLVILYRIGKQYINAAFGWIWVMTYGGTILTLLYFKSGIIDPWFNLFIFLAIYFFSFLTEHDAGQRWKRTVLAGVLLGLAVLTKGPVAILICVLCLLVYWIIYRLNTAVRFLEIIAVVLITAAISFLWFGIELKNNGIWFIKEFVIYQIRLFQTQDAGHGGPFFYHWYVLLIGCFPASLFAIKAFFMKALAEEHQRSFFRWMEIMFWVVLILFSIVKTKIVHYSSLTYFPISFLASYALYFLIHGDTKWNNWIRISQYIIGFFISFLLIAFPIAMKNVNEWRHLIQDPFAQDNLLAKINWAWYDSIGGFILLAGLIAMLFMNKKHHYRRASITLYLSLTTAVFFTSVLIVPKVEAFSQRSAIHFYQSLKGKDVYVQPMYFKSYAHLFYFERGPLAQPQAYDHEWLRSGPIDKDLYIVVKTNMRSEIERYKDIQFIREENGFAFYLRKRVNQSLGQ